MSEPSDTEGVPHRHPSLRAIFAGRRGRLLAALLIAEFGIAVHSTAYSSVLPIVSNDLGGDRLYGATLVAGTFATIMILAVGPGPFSRLGPAGSLLLSTVLFVIGTVLTVAAVSMGMILAGSVIRGLGAGLFAGFGLTALGTLYDDAMRPRVVGLFAVMWLLPSIVGPVANSAMTIAIGWRAAMGWPALLVLLGRMLIGRHISMIPSERTSSPSLQMPYALLLLGGLVLAAAAPAPHNSAGVCMLIAGIGIAIIASLRIMHRQVGSERRRLLTMVAMFLLCFGFFGGSDIISLAAINGLGYGIIAGSAAMGVGLLGWSVTGMRPLSVDARLGDPQIVGLVLLIVALGLVSGSLLALAGTMAVSLLIGTWLFGGIGMGLAYNRIFSESVDGLAPERVYVGAIAVEFSETSATAIGTLFSGGSYSLATALDVTPHISIGVAFGVLAVVTLVGVLVRGVRQYHPVSGLDC